MGGGRGRRARWERWRASEVTGRGSGVAGRGSAVTERRGLGNRMVAQIGGHWE